MQISNLLPSLWNASNYLVLIFLREIQYISQRIHEGNQEQSESFKSFDSSVPNSAIKLINSVGTSCYLLLCVYPLLSSLWTCYCDNKRIYTMLIRNIYFFSKRAMFACRNSSNSLLSEHWLDHQLADIEEMQRSDENEATKLIYKIVSVVFGAEGKYNMSQQQIFCQRMQMFQGRISVVTEKCFLGRPTSFCRKISTYPSLSEEYLICYSWSCMSLKGNSYF